MVEFVDVYPTLVELAGLPAVAHAQGTSAVPLLRDGARLWKSAVFSQFLRKGTWAAPYSQPYMGYSLLTEDHHYVRWIHWETKVVVARELYDRRKDPNENENLAARPGHATLLDSLERQRAAGWRAARPR